MRRILLFFALVVQLGAAASPDFAARRASLRKSIPDGILVVFGNKESEDLHHAFFQQTSGALPTDTDEIERALAQRN